MQRIHVIGGPGSGKTTFARRLATLDALPVYDLDVIGYAGGAGPKRPLDVRLTDVRLIAAQPAWITEGSFLWWTEELMERADVIVWLDVSWRLAAWRIIRRHVFASLARTNRHWGIGRLLSFLRSARRYYVGSARSPTGPDDDNAVTAAATAQALATFDAKVVRCRRDADVDAFIAGWRRSPSTETDGCSHAEHR